MTQPSPKHGEAYEKFIADQLTVESARTKTLEDRGFAIATSSSAFLALLLAILGLISPDKYKLTGTSAILAGVSLLTLAIAALLGLLANISGTYSVAASETLRSMIDQHWTDDEDEARRLCARQNADTVRTLRRVNNRKASLNYTGQITQLAGLAILAAAFVLATNVMTV